MKKTTFTPPPKKSRVFMTKARARKCPVLREVLKYADSELALHMRWNFAPMIKRMDWGQHREYILKHCKGVVRDILEETFGALIAVSHTGDIAGVGAGTYTTGYRRTVQAYQELADAELARKQSIAFGLGDGHEDIAGLIEDATGTARPVLRVAVEQPMLPSRLAPPVDPLPRIAGSTVDLAKGFIKGMFGDSN